MEENLQTIVAPEQKDTLAQPVEEKKQEGIEHDPYEWGQCAITANIVWLPDGSVMLGVRSHLDAPLISVLSGEELITLPGYAAELPIPAAETIANLLAELREQLPQRARAKAERDEAARKKMEEAKNKRVSGKHAPKPAPATSSESQSPSSAQTQTTTKLPPVGKAPAAKQVSLFNFMTGGN